MIALLWLGGYLLTGLVSLALFDLLTGRVRSRIDRATGETQERMASAGMFMSRRAAWMLIVLLIWLYWPAVLYGYVEAKVKGERHGAKRP